MSPSSDSLIALIEPVMNKFFHILLNNKCYHNTCSVCQLIHQLIDSTTDSLERLGPSYTCRIHHTPKRVFIIDEMSE